MIGIFALAIFGCIAILTLVIVGVVNIGLARYEARYLDSSAQSLEEMFYFIDGRQLLVLTLAVSISFGLVGYIAFNWFVGVMMLGIGFIIPFVGVRKLKQRRIELFETQLVDVLVQMSSAFRAGMSLPQAAETVAQEMPAPISQELGLFIKELKLGVQQDVALQHMSERVGSEDLQLVVTATNIARKLGGNMAEMFDTISDTIRERFRLEGRIRSLTSQGKLQGWVVGAMPLGLGLVLNYMRPDLMKPMLNSNFGYALIALVIVMELIGMWLIRKIVAIDV